MRRRGMTYLTISLILAFIASHATAQVHDDWTGFEFRIGRPAIAEHVSVGQIEMDFPELGFAFPQYYELTKDYTIDMPAYFTSRTDLNLYSQTIREQEELVERVKRHSQKLGSHEWDFLKLEPGGILTIKKGYRWDGASAPCKKDIPPCPEDVEHVRSSMVHDALYDLMRMEYIPADKDYDPDGEKNRELADLLLYLISVEDREGRGWAGFYRIFIRLFGDDRTYDKTKLKSWKFRASELTAYPTDSGIKLKWKKANEADKAPTTDYPESNQYRVTQYDILRNGSWLNTVSADGGQEYLDKNFIDGVQYTYQLVANSVPDNSIPTPLFGVDFTSLFALYPVLTEIREYTVPENEDYWSNDDVVVRVRGAGNALRLGGVSQSVESLTLANDLRVGREPFEPFTETTSPFTMEAWVYPEPQRDGVIMGFHSEFSEDQDLQYFDGPNNQVFGVRGRASTRDRNFAPNNWYHVALTVDEENDGVLYVNGEIQIDDFYYLEPKLRVGDRFTIARHLPYSPRFKGLIDEVRVWKATRTQEQIQDNMCIPLSGDPLSGDNEGLVALWHFDAPTETEVISDFCKVLDPEGMNIEDIKTFILSNDRKFCTTYDGTSHANDGTLLGFQQIFDEPNGGPQFEKPFVSSGAMTPNPNFGEIIVGLDQSGVGSIDVDQIIENASNLYCADTIAATSRTEFSCADLGEMGEEGEVDVTLKFTDMNGIPRDDTATVTVADLVSPIVSDVKASHQVIRSTNDGMVTVTIDGASLSDNCSQVGLGNCEIVSVTASEPITDKGTIPDYEKTGPLTVNLRATSSPGHQRMYTLGVVCKDDYENVSEPFNVFIVVGAGNNKTGAGAISPLWLMLLLLAAHRCRTRRSSNNVPKM